MARIGDEAPNFTGTATDGTKVSLASSRGKVTVVVFFATWCPGCKLELPRIERDIQQKFKDSVSVIAMGRGHTWSELAQFKRSNGFGFTIVEDPRREIYGKYASDYIPRCYLIGKDGRIKYAITGPAESDFAEFKRRVGEEVKTAPLADSGARGQDTSVKRQ